MKTTYTKLTKLEWLTVGRMPDEGLKQFAKRRPEIIFTLALAHFDAMPDQIRKALEGFQGSSGWLGEAATDVLAGNKKACLSTITSLIK